ncbi:hypothetical protein WJN01_03205 [Flavobacteriaceae bacterium SZ-1-7]|uniref:hypothetical protein n=1 Tax=Tamlana sedimenti TaxID=3134126 RepID=UPI003128B604
MSDKKHIDRLFQESFKDFEVKPSDAVWKNIEAQLNQKKKKHRVIPIWWRYAGVAALLLLFLTLGRLYLNGSGDIPTNQVVDTEENAPNTNQVRETLPINDNVGENDVLITNTNDSEENIENTKSNLLVPSNSNSIAETSSSKVENESKAPLRSNLKLNSKDKILGSDDNQTLANISNKETEGQTLQNNLVDKSKIIVSNEGGEDTENILIDSEKAKNIINNSSGNNTEIAKTNDEVTQENVVKNNLTIEEAVDINKDLLTEEKAIANNRWSIAPNAAPVYFNTLGEGSSIDPQFNNNSKTGELNMSYGITASYALNDKIKVRSGINKVNLGYNTNDIITYQSVGLSSSSNALQNVNGSTSEISVVSSEVLASGNVPQSLFTSNTTINQAFGYIEVPLEIQYTVLDKKLGLNIIGGFSSFFLDKNEIYSKTANGPQILLGEANNINKMSYSANFGLGLNYQISKKFDLNLEPMFKYQFNTFNNTSGNFTPFFIGVYTGFAIKF